MIRAIVPIEVSPQVDTVSPFNREVAILPGQMANLIKFESIKTIEKNRDDLREARSKVIKDAKDRYEKEERKKEAAKKRGEDTWMLASVNHRLNAEEETLKVSKKKKKKEKHRKQKEKKKKKKKKKESSSSSDSSSDDEEAQWVVKGDKKKEESSQPTQGAVRGPRLERDSWMSAPLDLVPTLTRQDLIDKKNKEKQELEEQKRLLEQPGQHAKELNPYWKDGGTGVPEENSKTKLVTKGTGDSGLSWLRKSYQRCVEQAKEEGRSLEDLASERWGSLEKIQSMIKEAEKLAGVSPRDERSEVRKNRFRRPGEGSRSDRDSMRSDRDSLRSDRDTLRSDRDSLRSDRDSMRSDRDSMRSDRDSMRSDRDSMRLDRDSMRSDRDSLRSDRDTLRSDRDSLRSDRDSLRLDRDSLRSDRDSMRLDRDSMRSDRDSMRLDSDSMGSDRDSMRLDRDSMGSDRDSMRSDRDSMRSDRDSMRLDRDSMGSDRDSTRSDRDSTRLDRDSMRLDRDSMGSDRDSMRLDRDSMGSDRDSMRSESHRSKSRRSRSQSPKRHSNTSHKRSRSRERDHRNRSRSRSRDRHKRSNSREKEHRKRSRSRDRSRRERSTSREKQRHERSRSRDRYKRERSRSCDRQRHRSRSRDRVSSSSSSMKGRFMKPGEMSENGSSSSYRTSSKSGSSSAGPAWKKKEFHKPVVDEDERDREKEKERERRNEREKERRKRRKSSDSSSSDSSSSSSDSSDSESDSEKGQRSRSEEAKVTKKVLTETEMNALGAKILKAEIMGNKEQAEKLKSQLEEAREARKNIPAGGVVERREEEKEDFVVLTRTDRSGMARPVPESKHDRESHSGKRRKKQKVETHTGKEGERVRYFADDDQFDLKTLVEREKMGTAEDQNAMFSRLAGRAMKTQGDDFQVDDIFLSKANKKQAESVEEERDRARAIMEHKQMASSMEKCHFCFAKVEKHLIVAIGTKVYLSLPVTKSLTEGHCLIVPMQHVASSTTVDEDVWSEIQLFRKTLTKMFNDRDEDVVFMETSMKLKYFPHMCIEVVPFDREVGDTAPIYFKKAIQETGSEWAENKKVVDISQKDIRHAVPKGFPYFSVDFGNEGGFAHVIEDERTFPAYFGKEIIGGMIDADHSLWRKPHKENFDAQRKKVLRFSEMWKPYDWTQNLSKSTQSDSSSDSD